MLLLRRLLRSSADIVEVENLALWTIQGLADGEVLLEGTFPSCSNFDDEEDVEARLF